MQFKSDVTVYAVKESKGTIEGRDFSSCIFHCAVDLKENTAGRSIGVVTRPFKLGDASEFDKWAHLGNSLPLVAEATFDMVAGREDGTSLSLVAIVPKARAAAPAAAKV